MTAPRRIQLSGPLPGGAVDVSRGRVDRFGWGPLPGDPTGERLVVLLEERPGVVARIERHLAGRVLACSCPVGEPCHGDVLLAVANGMSAMAGLVVVDDVRCSGCGRPYSPGRQCRIGGDCFR